MSIWLNLLSENPVLERLVVTSLEFAALAAVVGAFIFVFRVRQARLRALLWLAVLAKPLAGLVLGTPLALVHLAAPAPSPMVMTALAPEAPVEDHGREARATAEPAVALEVPAAAAAVDWGAHLPGLLTGIWMAGVAIFGGWLFFNCVRLGRLVRRAGAPPEWIAARLAALADELGLRRAPRCMVTPLIESPALAGFVRPVILLPEWLGRAGDAAQVEWSLRHELMHHRLRDPLAGLVCELARIAFFFHPLAWWAGRRWRESMEMACDRALVRSLDEAENYVEQLYRMLLQVRGQRRLPVAGGLFAGRTQISKRIASLTGDPLRSPVKLSGAAILLVLLICAASMTVGVGLQSRAAEPPSSPFPLSIASTPPTSTRSQKILDSSIGMDFDAMRGDHFNTDPDGNTTIKGHVRLDFKLGSCTIAITGDRAEFPKNRPWKISWDAPEQTKVHAIASLSGKPYTLAVTADKITVTTDSKILSLEGHAIAASAPDETGAIHLFTGTADRISIDGSKTPPRIFTTTGYLRGEDIQVRPKPMPRPAAMTSQTFANLSFEGLTVTPGPGGKGMQLAESKENFVITADRITNNAQERKIILEGSVHMKKPGLESQSDKASMTFDRERFLKMDLTGNATFSQDQGDKITQIKADEILIESPPGGKPKVSLIGGKNTPDIRSIRKNAGGKNGKK